MAAPLNSDANATSPVLRYQITEVVYVGSRTLVYRAIRKTDNLPVIIKLLKQQHPSFNELVSSATSMRSPTI